MVERVSKFFRVRPVAVAEAWVIGRYQVIAVRKPGEEWLEYSRRRGQAVEQEKRWRVFRPGLSLNDGESISLYRAIRSRVLHGTFLSLGVGRQLKYCEHHRKHQHHTRNLQESGPTGRVERVHSLPPL